MKGDFLGAFMGDPARARLLRVFVFGAEPLTLPQAAKRAGIGTKAALRQIAALEKLGIVKKEKASSNKPAKAQKAKGAKPEPTWVFDTDFKHARPLASFVHEVSPMRRESIVGALKNSGRLAAVVLSGCFMGDTTRPVDLIVAADNLNEVRLEQAVRALEPLFGREIRYSAFSTPEFRYRLTIQDHLIRDTLDYPHQVLLDRLHLL